MSDLGALGLFSVLLLGAVASGEGLRLVGWAPESSRRVVHALVGLAVAACPQWFSRPGPIYVLAVVFLVSNFVAARKHWIPGMHAIERLSWGTVTFPLALLVALALCWSVEPHRVYILPVAFVVLALADPAASLVGTRIGRPGLIGVAAKSFAGSAAFFVVAAASTAIVLGLTTRFGTVEIGARAFVVASLATLAEALGRKGWDNLWIVLAVVIPLSRLDERPGDLGLHLDAVAVAIAFGLVVYWVRFLDLSGALAASGLAWMLIALGTPGWSVPAVTFFVLSSLLSKLGRRQKADTEVLAEKGSRRDAAQVAANGGVGAILLAASVFVSTWEPYWLLYSAFLGAFAAAAADTWATEIGTLARGRTRTLVVGPRVPPGTSGGMSVAGTLGAVLGATTVVGSALISTHGRMELAWGAMVVSAGVGGSVVDSLLGATLQARYCNGEGHLTEQPEVDGHPLPLAAGFRGLGNDGVNWACTAAGAGLAALGALALR